MPDGGQHRVEIVQGGHQRERVLRRDHHRKALLQAERPDVRVDELEPVRGGIRLVGAARLGGLQHHRGRIHRHRVDARERQLPRDPSRPCSQHERRPSPLLDFAEVERDVALTRHQREDRSPASFVRHCGPPITLSGKRAAHGGNLRSLDPVGQATQRPERGWHPACPVDPQSRVSCRGHREEWAMRWMVVVAAVLLGACSGGGLQGKPGPDGETPPPPDAGGDAPDAGVDAGDEDGGIDGGEDGGTDAGVDAGPIPLPTADGWTFYGPQHGGPRDVHSVSSDSAGNIWVAGGKEGLFLLEPGASELRRFTVADGLTGYIDPTAPTVINGHDVISVAGGPANTVFVGYRGIGTEEHDPVWMLKSGDADRVVCDGAGITVTHFDLSSPPGLLPTVPGRAGEGAKRPADPLRRSHRGRVVRLRSRRGDVPGARRAHLGAPARADEWLQEERCGGPGGHCR